MDQTEMFDFHEWGSTPVQGLKQGLSAHANVGSRCTSYNSIHTRAGPETQLSYQASA